MRYIKRIATGVVTAMTAVMLVVPASAHSGHYRQSNTSVQAQPVIASCNVCTTADCHTTGRHSHGGVTYCGYDHADGVCNGSCAALCTVTGCTATGRHIHNGVTYCGYDHADGFCDGSCATTVRRNGHHSSHNSHGHH